MAITFKNVPVTVQNVDAIYVDLTWGSTTVRVEKARIRDAVRGELDELQLIFAQLAKRLNDAGTDTTTPAAVKAEAAIESAPFWLPRG